MLASKKILIADDNDLVRKLLRIMLENHKGWVICAEAADGPQAVVKAKESNPDAVILDFAMPIMDGLGAAREITRALPSVPILLFTLYDSPEMALAAKEAGVSRVLPKTASGLPLIQAVQDLLANGSESTCAETPCPNA